MAYEMVLEAREQKQSCLSRQGRWSQNTCLRSTHQSLDRHPVKQESDCPVPCPENDHFECSSDGKSEIFVSNMCSYEDFDNPKCVKYYGNHIDCPEGSLVLTCWQVSVCTCGFGEQNKAEAALKKDQERKLKEERRRMEHERKKVDEAKARLLFGDEKHRKSTHGRMKPHGYYPNDLPCERKEDGMCGHKMDCKGRLVHDLCDGRNERVCCAFKKGMKKSVDTGAHNGGDKDGGGAGKEADKGLGSGVDAKTVLGEQKHLKQAELKEHGAYSEDAQCTKQTGGLCGHLQDCVNTVIKIGLCGRTNPFRQCCVVKLTVE